MQAQVRRLKFAPSRWVVLSVAVVIAVVGGVRVVPWAAATTSSGDRAIFEPLPPARILDTRSPSNPVGPGESRLLQVTGSGGVPVDATAVVLNVTAVAPTAGGWLTLYPADAPLPLASNVNFSAGQTVPNSVQVKLGAGAQAGQIKIFNSAGQTHVIVDVGGYFRAHDHDDRYYTKAQAQARIAANSLTCPAGQFLNTVAANGAPTCGVGAQGPPGPQGVPGPSGPKSFTSLRSVNLPDGGIAHYQMVTPTFVVPTNVTSCQVTSTVQMEPPANAPNRVVTLLNAVTRNAVNSSDGQDGQFLYNDGAGRAQPPMTRSSVLAVAPGETVSFGVFFTGLTRFIPPATFQPTAWVGAPYSVTTSYLCS